MTARGALHVAIVRDAQITGGGISRVVESWARILGRAGHRVTIISEAHDAARALPEIPNLSQVIYEAIRTRRRASRLAARARAATRATIELARERPVDVLISHTAAVSVELRRRFRGVPLLQSFHSPMVDENRLNNWKYSPTRLRSITYPATWAVSFLLERWALRSIDCAHTLSDFTWNRLRALHASACSRVEWRRIPGTFDAASFVPAADRDRVRERLGLARAASVLFTVRRLVPRNGVDRILLCAERLESVAPNALYLIGGAGALRPELERRVAESALSGRVRLLGFVPDEDLPAYYQAADAFLLPTRDLECFGLPVIEAMGCGCIPLVTPDGGPAEILRARPECLAAENTDAAFVDLVRRFLEGRIPADRAALAGDAVADYSETAVSSSVLEVIGGLAARLPRSTPSSR